MSVKSWQSSARYYGSWPCNALYTRTASLKSMHCRTGNQCSSLRTGVICSRLPVYVISSAAAFWTDWSFCSSLPAIPHSRRICDLSSGVIPNDLEWPWRSLLWFEPFLNPTTQEILHALSTLCYSQMNQKACMVCNNFKDFPQSRAVTYTEKVKISWKRCKIETLLLQTTNRKWYTLYRMAPFPMT